MIVDLFAGIGWAEGLAALGLHETGIELSPTACATRRDAGHTTIEADVTALGAAAFGHAGLIASPPCPPFSKAGTGRGRHDLPHIHQAIDDLAAGRDTRAEHGARCCDPRSILTAEPMRWITALTPGWVLMEQVPSVLRVWEHYAAVLRARGYSTAAGVLDAAAFGLGSRRPRAVLIASRYRDAALPRPTHGPGLLPPVAMADTIGWGYTRRPAPTVTSGGTSTGGAEPFGNGSRQAMRRAAARDDGSWKSRPGTAHLRPTLAEAMALNGLRPDLPVAGNAGQQFTLVGNVVPPPLAAALVRQVTA